MNVCLIFALIGVASAADRYNITENDVNFLTDDFKRLKEHIDCYLDKGPCDEIGQFYKTHLPEVIRTLCGQCNDDQRQAAYTFNIQAARLFPEDHKEFLRKYDLEGNYDAYIAAVAPKS